MSLRIDLWVPSWSGVPHTVQYTVFTSGTIGRHDVTAKSLPMIVTQVEQNLAEFTSGDVTLEARNDDGWWDSTAFTATTLNPTQRFPTCLYVNIFVGGGLVFQGDIDVKSISFDRKEKTVSFTCLGPLHRLEQWSAETVRRPFPSFCDMGVATATGAVAPNWYLRDALKLWYAQDVTNCVLIDKNGTIWTIVGLYGVGVGTGRDGLTLTNPVSPPGRWGAAPTTPPPVGSYMIRPCAFVTRYNWNSLAGALTSGAGFLNDAGKAWTVNQWVNYYVYDSKGAVFGPVTSNTATRLNFASGTPDVSGLTYNIRKSNYPNLLESLGPSIATLGIVGQTPTDAGDLLKLTSTSGIFANWNLAWGPGPGSVTTQDDEIMFAGPYAGGPTLTDHMLWMTDAIGQEISERDGIVLGNPYYRDKTLAQLVVLLFLACANAVPSYAVNVPAFADDVVPYADFEGKSVAEALVELASISNCTLSCVCTGTVTTPAVTFEFQRRDAGLGSVIDLSGAEADGTSKLLSREDLPLSEWYFPYISVQGSDGAQVQQGSPRPGGQSLDVQSDYMDTYPWLHQVLDRLWNYFGQKRPATLVKVKAEHLPAATVGVAAVVDDFESDTLHVMPAGWTQTAGNPGEITVEVEDTQVMEMDSLGVAEIARWDTPGTLSDLDITFDALIHQTVDQCYLTFFWRMHQVAGLWYGYELMIGAGTDTNMFGTLKHVNGGTIDPLVVTSKPLSIDDVWRFRIKAAGTLLLVKWWLRSEAEPADWDIAYLGADVTAGVIWASMGSFGAPGIAMTSWYDNFNILGTPGGPGIDLLSRVSLSGADEWWVMRLSRPVREPAAVAEMTLLSAVAAAYVPGDYTTVDKSALPEPPQITGVTVSGADRIAALTWPFPIGQLLGFQCTLWTSTRARPKEPTYFSAVGTSLTIIAGTPPTFTDKIFAVWLAWAGAGPWYVDYQAVLIDGRTCKAGSAFQFS